MVASIAKFCAVALAAVIPVFAKNSFSHGGGVVKHTGEPKGFFKEISGIQTYHSYPKKVTNTSTAILFLTDIFGVPLLENKLLADSLAESYPVIMPDYFRGDAIDASNPEALLNLTAWSARHPLSDIETIITSTIAYMRTELNVTRIGAVGYCFGGKYVPRFQAGRGIDVGFVAHPSNLTPEEIQAIAGPISFAAGELDNSFNTTARVAAEGILQKKNATYQTTLYSGAPHGFAVRVDLNSKRQVFAKEAAFAQAVRWFDFWL